ncbi:MAG TPA: hypothetical protein VF069_19535 [Streptosporangiaceae bacterium]
MSDFTLTGELHLRVAGHTTDWKLLLVDEKPTQDQVSAWMQDGAVVPLRVAEQGSHEPYTLLVNFSFIVAARILPAQRDRSVRF